MKNCKNNLIIDPAQGSIVFESDAYTSQPAEVISTADAVLSGPDVLQPVASCDTPTPPEPTYCCREVTYVNYVKSVTVGGTGFDFLELVADMVCTDPGAVLDVDWGDGSPVEPVPTLTMVPHSVAGVADGAYVGTVTSNGAGGNATAQFVYRISGGLLTNIQYFQSRTITPDVSCNLYPNYTITINDAMSADANMFNEYSCRVNSIIEHTETADPVNFSTAYVVTNDFSSDTVLIEMNMSTLFGPGSLATAIITTQCVSE